MNFDEALENIKKEMRDYYKMSFENETEEVLYNKSLKDKLKKLVMLSQNETEKNKAILVLAKSTGCA